MPVPFTPSAEQQAVIDAYLRGEDLAVQAGAGTGKSTTLAFIADAQRRRRPGATAWYLTFNKRNAEEVQATFKKYGLTNARASTAHSYANRACRATPSLRHMVERLNRRDLKIGEELRLLGIGRASRCLAATIDVDAVTPTDDGIRVPRHDPSFTVQRRFYTLTRKTVDKFCQSADDEVTWKHVPSLAELQPQLRPLVRRELIASGQRMWDELCRPTSPLGTGHGHYLKAWALTRPAIGSPGDVLLYDECQDANPVLAEVVVAQRGRVQLALVGDEFQQIYCQPLGTKVHVPVPDQEPDRPCSLPKCNRERRHSDTGYCDWHQQQLRDGKELYPYPKYKIGESSTVAIEDLRVGDRVCTHHNATFYNQGRPVTGIQRFAYAGDLITVHTETGLSSSYTDKHHCVVRMSSELRNKHVVYLMRRGNQFRIGRCPMGYKGDNNGFGVRARSFHEKADAAWILKVTDTSEEAQLAEWKAQHDFSIPGVCFEAGTRHKADVRAFWNHVGDNTENAAQCLEHHGRLMEFPFITMGSGLGASAQYKSPFVTAACNLFDGLSVLPFTGRKRFKGKHEYISTGALWEPIKVTREPYCGDVVSLTVEDHHTYFADGILTHNSFTGSIDAMQGFVALPGVTTLPLTESRRFGPTIAAEANKVLDTLDPTGSGIRLVGIGAKNGQVRHRYTDADATAVTAITCRTNALVIDHIMTQLQAGRRVYSTIDIQELQRLAKDVQLVESGRAEEAKNVVLQGFTDLDLWNEWLDDGEPESQDLRDKVKVILDYGIAQIAELASELEAKPQDADVTVSTVHKAKGGTWDSVLVDMGDQPIDEEDDEKLRLLYVALTRARHLVLWKPPADTNVTTGARVQKDRKPASRAIA
ncbi:hypothetical protein A5742_17815 [Mycolicibacterium fortuitum]|uniref:Hint domain-containing protein n=1 Tax=Mycolicibacterium fortuitum TaxID=1766 RepID=A0ABD6QT99_MYCFO|nr:ATP-binding domain-containing protein [Mycolicibacterium fortuitum]OMC51986.1 hypothetical protein A5742_17815 [Mycolicibacterium fortuitum]